MAATAEAGRMTRARMERILWVAWLLSESCSFLRAQTLPEVRVLHWRDVAYRVGELRELCGLEGR